MKIVYPAIFAKEKDGSYTVSFPDLEGCTARGADFEEALEQAKDAGISWVSLELEEGNDLPAQSHPDDLELEDNMEVRYVSLPVKLVEGYD